MLLAASLGWTQGAASRWETEHAVAVTFDENSLVPESEREHWFVTVQARYKGRLGGRETFFLAGQWEYGEAVDKASATRTVTPDYHRTEAKYERSLHGAYAMLLFGGEDGNRRLRTAQYHYGTGFSRQLTPSLLGEVGYQSTTVRRTGQTPRNTSDQLRLRLFWDRAFGEGVLTRADARFLSNLRASHSVELKVELSYPLFKNFFLRGDLWLRQTDPETRFRRRVKTLLEYRF